MISQTFPVTSSGLASIRVSVRLRETRGMLLWSKRRPNPVCTMFVKQIESKQINIMKKMLLYTYRKKKHGELM